MHQSLTFIFRDIITLVYILVRNCIGTLTHPYLTWKKITREPQLIPAFVLLSIISFYFVIQIPLQWDTHLDLFTWITRSIFSIGIAFISYLLTTGIIWFIANQINPQPHTYIKLLSSWIYSYLPTIGWFTITAITFIFVPPPRYPTFQGITFSVLYIAFSIAMLSWKALLYILTLRLACHLSLKQVIIASFYILPSFFIYSYLLLKLNIWRVPFI